MAGTYTFSYNPCIGGCPASSFAKPIIIKTKLIPTIPEYEGVEPERMEEFIKQSTKELISAMKN